jgi:hypothetical protein
LGDYPEDVPVVEAVPLLQYIEQRLKDVIEVG